MSPPSISHILKQHGHIFTVFTMNSDTQQLIERRGSGHALWLAMRSAYGEYRDASEALDLTIPEEETERSSPEDSARLLEALITQTRSFERYVEARCNFSEYAHDQPNPEEEAPGDSIPPSVVRRYIPYAMVVALLGTNLLVVGSNWKRVRDLEAARDQSQAMLNQARSAIQDLTSKLEHTNPGTRVSDQKFSGARAGNEIQPVGLPLAGPNAMANEQRIAPQPSQTQRKQSSEKRDPRGKTPVTARTAKVRASSEKAGNRNYYAFTLTPSRDFQRVGPISVSLRSINRERNRFDVSLKWNGLQSDEKNVKINEPLSIRLINRQPPLELVVTKIERGKVQGYLAEPRPSRPEHAANNVQKGFPNRP